MKILIIVLILIKYANAGDPTPIVLWHGMGDTCCVVYSVGGYKYLLEKAIPGVYVMSIKVGSTTFEDLYNSYFMDPNEQIKNACKTIEEDPKLKNGFNAIGFSQGGQFLRALIQRCGHKMGRVKNLITLGSQHQGVYGSPHCGALVVKSCTYIRELIDKAPYAPWVQRDLVLATYWHEPLHEQEYKNNSIFLSDINNELSINQTYNDNLNKLDHFVMVMFNNDTVTQPRESSWFGFYKPGQDQVLQTLQESDLYKEDRIGLKKMDEAGKLVFLSTPGDHLRVSKKWFIENIVKVYLSPQ
ncbi:palmitoyl-protein thioesterase 1-like isoform X2 [Plodia interpunctella]|uniref:palmitoyl-protein thioesterase 1-like isoform X2 n=1 Tax=Plodia interpunctella TaxID=58824 RepID=UPI0023675BBD|nr:palmitoyl-protein thioesterase 1-like isoform X2 [Plodia interpunctella]